MAARIISSKWRSAGRGLGPCHARETSSTDRNVARESLPNAVRSRLLLLLLRCRRLRRCHRWRRRLRRCRRRLYKLTVTHVVSSIQGLSGSSTTSPSTLYYRPAPWGMQARCGNSSNSKYGMVQLVGGHVEPGYHENDQVVPVFEEEVTG